jgi:aldehyde:ferredoxin oxidoreductase
LSRIVYVNLSDNVIEEKEYSLQKINHYGRGLAGYLMQQYVPPGTGRHSKDNCIVLAAGLFPGTEVPSTGRLILASKHSHGAGIQFLNLAGPFSQKMASLDITAVVISGRNNKDVPVVLSISENGVEIQYVPDLKEKEVSETINYIRRKFSVDCAVLGIGPAGEHLLPLASVFTTYPEGIPVFNCVRGGMGDIFGSKGLKAIAVTTKAYFSAKVFDREKMRESSKKLTRIIIDHPICGGALPAYGSITLMKMMKSGQQSFLETNESTRPAKEMEKEAESGLTPFSGRINRTCAPGCVVGCLNRHAGGRKRLLSSPADNEVFAALKEAFDIQDQEFASTFNGVAFEQGIDSVEFVFTCALLFKILNKRAGKKDLLEALDEVRKLTFLGRILAGGTNGVYRIYQDQQALESMVTRPSVTEESRFNVKLPFKIGGFEGMDDKEYLYALMITFGNLGLCLFTSFALIENQDAWKLLSEMYYYKTGISIHERNLIDYSIQCLKEEENYEMKAKEQSVQKAIPEFVKVLYRYFGKEVED